MTSPDKKYIVVDEKSGQTFRFGADQWATDQHDFMADYPGATIIEYDSYTPENLKDNDTVFVNTEDGTYSFTADEWKKDEESFRKNFKKVEPSIARGVDYYYNQALDLESQIEQKKQSIADWEQRNNAEREKRLQWNPDTPAVPFIEDMQAAHKETEIETEGNTLYSELDDLERRFYANPRVSEAMEENMRLREEAQRKYVADLQTEAEGMLAEAGEDVVAEKLRTHETMMNALDGQYGSLFSAKGPSGETKEQVREYNKAGAALTMLQHAKDIREGKADGFFEGMGNVVKKDVKELMYQSESESFVQVALLLKRLNDEIGSLDNLTSEDIDKHLNKEEALLLRSYFELMSAQKEARVNWKDNWKYTAGEIAGESIKFALEFAAIGGLADDVAKGATKGLTLAMEQWIDRGLQKGSKALLRKGVAWTADKVLRGGIKSAIVTAMRPSTYDTIAQHLPEQDEEGNIRLGRNALIGALDAGIETISEMSGDLISKGLGVVMKPISKGLGKVGKGVATKMFGEAVQNVKFNKWSVFFGGVLPDYVKAAGFHGVVPEMLEEVVGNAMRLSYGDDSLYEMFKDGNGRAMLLGFVPMTIFGGAASVAQFRAVDERAAKIGERLGNFLASKGYEQGRIEALTERRTDKSPLELDVQMRLLSEELKKNGATEEELKLVDEYAMAVAEFQTLRGITEMREKQDLQEENRALTQQYGKVDVNGQVTTAETKDGRTVFLVSERDGNGQYAAVDQQTGKQSFVTDADIASVKDAKGNDIAKRQSVPLNTYLGERLNQRNRLKEAERMLKEKSEQIARLNELMPEKLNLGTEAEPVMVAVKSRDAKGVVVVDENGNEQPLSWEAVGRVMGLPIRVFTDEEISELEQKEIALEREARRAARAEAYAENEEVAKEVDEISEKLKQGITRPEAAYIDEKTGKVDETSFWENDPEGYCEWNDREHKGDPTDSLDQIQNSLDKLYEKQKGLEKTKSDDPVERKAVNEEKARLQERIGKLEGIKMGYVQKALQKVKETAEDMLAKEEERGDLVIAMRERINAWRERFNLDESQLAVYESVDEVANPEVKKMIMRGDYVPGWTTGKHAFIYLPQIDSVEKLDKTVMHEVVTHYGFRALFPNTKEGQEEFNKLMDKVWNMMSDASRRHFSFYANIASKEGDERRRAAAEEFVAHVGENVVMDKATTEEKSFWKRFVEFFTSLFDKVQTKLTGVDVAEIVRNNYNRLAQQVDAQQSQAEAQQEQAVEEAVAETPAPVESITDIADAAPHNPVGYVNENGEREFRMPENTVEIVKEGLDRYSEIRRGESVKINDAIKEFARRSVEKGRISQEAVDSVLGEQTTMFKTEDVANKEVMNLVLDSTEMNLPQTREEAIDAIPKSGKICKTSDGTEVRVSRRSVRHSVLHKNKDSYALFGVVDGVLANAVKIGEIPVAEDEIGKTNSVSVYYAPVRINGTQYSARIVVKETIHNEKILDILSLYNVALHNEKTPSNTNVGVSEETRVYSDGVKSAYKVKDLIHNSQAEDKKLVGIENETTFFKTSPRTAEQRTALFEAAKEEFGVTNNFGVAGYMLPDGALLDFSEAKDGGPANKRTRDHREVGSIIEDRDYDTRSEYITDFLNEGAIRIMPESDAVNLSVAPSAEQREKLLDYFYKKNGYIILEIDDQNGKSAAYMEYDKGTSPYRIMRDIDNYFNEGIVPQQNTMFKTSSKPVTYDNFYKETAGVWEIINPSEAPNRAADYESTRFGEPEKVSSRYWYGSDENGDYVIRESDHWSASLHGEASIEDFKANPMSGRYTPISSARWAIDMRPATEEGTYNKVKPEFFKEGKAYGKIYLADLERMGQTMFKTRPHQSSLEEITDMFYAWNQDESLRPLFRKAYDFCNEIDLDVKFVSEEEMVRLEGKGEGEQGARGINWGEKIRLNSDVFANIPDQLKASIILHEMIHAATNYILIQKEERLEYENHREAKRELEAIFEEIKNKFPDQYGSTDVNEMVAEMAKPEFRDVMKQGTWWERFLNAIRRLLGISEKDYDRLTPTLAWVYELMDNPSFELFEEAKPNSEEYTLFKTAIAPEVRKEMDVIAAQAMVNGNYLLAPNGKDTKLTPEQWALVRTEDFKEEYGDWENDPENSLVPLDENGEPTENNGEYSESEDIRFKVRTKPAPVKTKEVYKLMRLGKDGLLYPLFIGGAEAIILKKWYDADSPNLGDLTKLATGIHLVNNETGEAMTFEEFKKEHPEMKLKKKAKKPNPDAINWATENGMRWVLIEDKGKKQKRYGGETRSYYNLGINGAGGVGKFAMRPGWHAGSLPSMRQIGKGANKDLRDDSFVWVRGRVPADVDYQAEADANPDKDIPTHIPTDGYYMKATNANKKASQADRIGWYVAGSFIADEIISDAEARRVIDTWNTEHPDAKVEYDFARESGREFDPARGGLVESDTMFKTSRERALRGLVTLESSNASFEAVQQIVKNRIEHIEQKLARLNKLPDTEVVKNRIASLEEELDIAKQQQAMLDDTASRLIDETLVEPDYASALNDTEPKTPEEAIAQALTMSIDAATRKKVGITLDPASLERELGWTKDDWKGIGYIVSPNGITLDRLAEMLGENSELESIFSGMDTMEIKNAIINFLQGVGTYAEIRDFIKNERMRQAKEEADEINSEILSKSAELRNGLTVEEYNSWKIEADRKDRRDQLEAAEAMSADPFDVAEQIADSAKGKANAANATLMDRIRKISITVASLRSVMASQKEYDKATVKAITDIASELLTSGMLTNVRKGEIKKLLSIINGGLGKADLTISANRLIDLMIGNQLHYLDEIVGKFMKARTKKVDSKGVEIRGEVDVVTQKVMKSFKDGMDLKLKDAELEEKIMSATDELSNPSEVIRNNAAYTLAGLKLAKRYREDIVASKAEEKALKDEIKDMEEAQAVGLAFNSEEDFRAWKESTEQAIRENRLERIAALQKFVEDLSLVYTGGIESAKLQQEEEKARVQQIQHYANSDMEGMPSNEHGKVDSMLWNNSLIRGLLAPLATFDQMLRYFGRKSVNGEGYLWNYFMRSWLKATENEYKGVQAAHEMLDAKAQELFGKEGVKRWSDIFDIDRKLPGATLPWWDGGEMRDHEVTQGNMLYIYMVNKMTDGKMKLRKMGISEEDVARLVDNMDPRFIEVADWIQDIFLPGLRDKYNAVHETMFGAAMAAIDSYFPIRVLANARQQDVDVAVKSGDVTPSTITGSIIKRTRNNLALDILRSNAFDVVLDHIQKMEHWAAFAGFNRDLNALLSYTKFRNRVKNMKGIYGAGEEVWDNFRKVAEIAAGVYQPAGKKSKIDTFVLNIAKGVTAGKINGRVYTAIKQLLSMPAFISDASAANLAKSLATPKAAWDWAMENLPLFEKRWKSRQAGDSRLMETDSDWKIWKSKVVELSSRYGMAPNAFVDAVTVAIGAKAIYDTKKVRYLEMGYSEAKADERAKMDATILFNESQQSNESAFLSAMQVDRTWASVLFTLFRNSSMGYQRMFANSISNLKHRMEKGYKQESIEFMKKQLVRDGLSEQEAEKAAEKMYGRSLFGNAMRAVTFGFLVQFAWNLGAYLPYFIAGDDDDEKEKMLEDAARHAMFGPIEGLAGGSILSDLGNRLLTDDGLKNFDPSLSPLVSDIKNIFKMYENDKVVFAAEMLNLITQMGIGVNPQTITDIGVAIYDACDGDPETSKEVALLIMKILNAPQSQIDKIYLDEIDFTADQGLDLTISEVAERYAKYKRIRKAHVFGTSYDEEKKEEVKGKYIRRFTQMAEEAKRTRGNETAKAYYEYLDNEYKEITETIRDLKAKIDDAYAKGDDESKNVYKDLLDSLMGTAKGTLYKKAGRYVKQAESEEGKMKKSYGERREKHEDRMLEARKKAVEKIRDLEEGNAND